MNYNLLLQIAAIYFTYLSRIQMTVFGASLKLSNTFFTNPFSSPSENSTCATSLFKIFKLGDLKNFKFFLSLISKSWELGSSRSFRNASMADMNLYFLKYSWVRGITTSQMKVQPATKKGYLLKNSSIETTIDSKLIFPKSGSATASEARQGKAVKRSIVAREKHLAKFWRELGEWVRSETGIFSVEERWRWWEYKDWNAESGGLGFERRLKGLKVGVLWVLGWLLKSGEEGRSIESESMKRLEMDRTSEKE